MKKITITFNFDEKDEFQICKDLDSIKKLIKPYAIDSKVDIKKERKKMIL